MSNVSELTPTWFREGVEAALLAPTAVNQQKFYFEFVPAKHSASGCPASSENGGKPIVMAKRTFSLIGFTQMDLGIAKCHFEIGAGKNHFEWG